MKEGIGGGIRRGNCSGMEAMTVIITFQTDYHRASGNELLMVSLEVMIYSDGDVFSVIVVTVIPKPQELCLSWSQWLNSQRLDSDTMHGHGSIPAWLVSFIR